jgi:enamine deaminase RidA (YjgF/YER057c/UK114 family)
MTQIVIHGDTIYLCGQTAEGMEGAGEQTRAILAKIDALLAEARSSKSKLLQVQIWLADIRYYEEMNAVWDAWVDRRTRRAGPPARPVWRRRGCWSRSLS